ncbi:MAG: hypothetical protein JWN77_1538 [Frankiales bacterium]|jgi:hypothetical protein|nr:hypothetical protein [Frankiales bacterium]
MASFAADTHPTPHGPTERMALMSDREDGQFGLVSGRMPVCRRSS